MITGKKIILRPITIDDAQQTLQLRYDMEANKSLMGFPFPVNMENELNWIKNLYPQGERKHIYLAIEDNESHGFAGYVSAKNINNIHGTAEFGIILSKEFRGKGLATETIQLFFKYLFEEINIRKVYLSVFEENEMAIHVYKKVGFQQEGKLKKHVWQDGRYKNVLIMGIFLEHLGGEAL